MKFGVKMESANDAHDKAKPHLRHLALQGHVGFDSLPEQLMSKSVGKGFVFNILCVGETGIGKSTLMDSLFSTRFDTVASSHSLATAGLTENTYDLKEGNVKLKLTITETVGYGDQINKTASFDNIIDYIDAQFHEYLMAETQIQRNLALHQDKRVHVCLYFISPSGHGLKPIDLLCMKALHKKVNIIPIIGKADSIELKDWITFKSKVRDDIESYGIDIYKFPTNDESVAKINEEMNSDIPFAVIGSTEFVDIDNRKTRARSYCWGVVEVENECHNDFVKLREMLIRTNMEDLRLKTHACHYERYRQKYCKLLKKIDESVAEFDKYYNDELKKLNDASQQLNADLEEFNKIKSQFQSPTNVQFQTNLNVILKKSTKKISQQSII